MSHINPETFPDPEELLLLAALYRNQGLREAGQEAGISLSSANRKLALMRKKIGDPLFRRSGNHMIPTAKMKALSEKLFPLLTSLQDFYSSRTFRPETLRGEFRIISTDNNFLNLIAPIIPRITEEAPHLTLEVMPMRRNGTWLIESGHADLGLYAFPIMRRGIKSTTIDTDRYCLVMRKGHPLATKWRKTGQLSLVDVAPHLQYMNRRFSKAMNDPCGYEAGPGRHRVYCPYFNSVPQAVLDGDAVQWTLEKSAARFAQQDKFVVVPAADIPDYGGTGEVVTQLLWAEREDLNPGNQWIRALLLSSAKESLEKSDKAREA